MSDTNGRYIPVILGHVKAFVCTECGSLVLDSLRHNQWHEQNKVAQPLCEHLWHAVEVMPDFRELNDTPWDAVIGTRHGRRCMKCDQLEVEKDDGSFEVQKEGKYAEKEHEHLWYFFFMSPTYKDYPKTLPGAQREARKCESCGQVDIRTVDGYVTVTKGYK